MLDFLKHLPPSADLPRVLALDEQAAAELPPELKTIAPQVADSNLGSLDAIIGYTAPTALSVWFEQLRPGGRLILVSESDPATLLQSLTEAGFIHCLVETVSDLTLYRGERPPQGNSLERIANLTSPFSMSPFIFLLISQTPNKPAWKLTDGEKIHWQAATLLSPQTQQPTLIAFSSLIKAVAFMQPAILAKRIGGVNKIGKFAAHVARGWNQPLTLNPVYADWQFADLGPMFEVDPQLAITGDE